MSLTIAQTRDDLLRKLGFMDAGTAPTEALQDVAQAINWAMQTLWRAGTNYFTKEVATVALVSGQRAYTLDQNIQSVLGQVITAGGKTLGRLSSSSEVEDFAMIYLGSSTRDQTNGAPVAYHIENRRNAGTDLHETVLFVVPPPNAAAVTSHSPLSFDAIRECTSYAVADLSATTAIPVADGYAETVFLPLARLQITRSHLFSKDELIKSIEADAAQAMQTLGLADPDSELKREGARNASSKDSAE